MAEAVVVPSTIGTLQMNPEGKVIDGIPELDPMSEMFVFGCILDYIRELGGNYPVARKPKCYSPLRLWRIICSLRERSYDENH